jgi:hypothetical protein
MENEYSHPIQRAIRDKLAESDFVVLGHGYARHGRDYLLELQGPKGTYILTLTHAVFLTCGTMLRPAEWKQSWDDVFTHFNKWEDLGKPTGFVFGVNYSVAWPGFSFHDSHYVEYWSKKLEKEMWGCRLQTNVFDLYVVFHEARLMKRSKDTDIHDSITIRPKTLF